MKSLIAKTPYNFSSFSFRILSDIHSKESLFFLLFGRDPLTPLRKLLSSKIRSDVGEKGLLDHEGIWYVLELARKNIYISKQQFDNVQKVTRSLQKSKLEVLYMSKDISHWLRGLQLEVQILNYKFWHLIVLHTGKHSKWKI